MEHAIATVYESAKTFLEKYDVKELKNLEERKDKHRETILNNLGFKETDDLDKVVELTPIWEGYHILINTAQTDKPKAEAVRESVQQILFKK